MKSVLLSLRLKSKTKQLSQTADEYRESRRVEAVHKLSKAFLVKLRIETQTAGIPGERQSNGFLIFADLSRSAGAKARFTARVIRFCTDDYESAIYEYERDLPGRVKIEPLWGDGYRAYVLGQCSLRSMWVNAKLSRTFGDRTENEFSLQIDYPR
jgi:hypothetical protein